MAFEIGLRHEREDAGKGQAEGGFFLDVGGVAEDSGDFGAGHAGHLLGTDHQRDAGPPGLDRIAGRIKGGRAGCAGILHTGGGRPAQRFVGLQHEGRGEDLPHEAAIELAEPDAVDLAGFDAGMAQRLPGDTPDQRFEIERIVTAERRVRPTYQTWSHRDSPLAAMPGNVGNLPGRR